MDTCTHPHTHIVGYRNGPLCTSMFFYPFSEAITPGATPRTPD